MSGAKHAVDLSKPVLKKAIEKERLVALMEDTILRWYPASSREIGARGGKGKCAGAVRAAQVRYNACHSSIQKFVAFLANRKSPVNIDERTINEVHDYLRATIPKDRSLRNHCGHIRKIINDLPSELRQRNLVTKVEDDRAHRFDTYTPETQKWLREFLKDGRRLKARSSYDSPVLSTDLLSKGNRSRVVDNTLVFMRRINATDLLALTEESVEAFVEEYREDDKEQIAYNTLDVIKPLFAYLLAKGAIQKSILTDIPRRKVRENLDYIPQSGIDKLADLSTVRMHDFKDVRDRLVTFSLYYDFALRNMEGLLLEVGDLRLDDETGLLLRKDIQKIKRDDIVLYSYFPGVTRSLLEQYLKLRSRMNPTTDVLIVSEDGLPLGVSGCRNIVKTQCLNLEILTYEGQIPCPHRLRHSFGTLNIEPLGRSLGITEVQEHLRHTSIEMTSRIYIAKNPILKKMRYQARMRNGRNAMGSPVRVDGLISVAPAPAQVFLAQPVDSFISEKSAIKQTVQLGIHYRALRKFGLKNSKVRKTEAGYEYSAGFISDLISNYFTRQEAMTMLDMPRSTFFDWTKNDGIEFVQIGQVGLFRKDLIMSKRRAS